MRYLRLILIAVLLASCVRPSSTSSIRVIEPTATLAVENPTPIPLPNDNTSSPAANTQPTAPAETLQAAPTQLQTPAVGATLSDVTAQTLLDFPLAAGNSWVYRFEGHTGTQKAVWKVSDTVVQVEMHGPYYAAKIQSEVALLEGAPGADFLNPPQAQTFWYVVNGLAVYRLEDPIDWTAVSTSWLELLFPFPSPTCWYPDPTQRAQTPAAGLPGCRSASGPTAIDTPAGHIESCFQVNTTYNGGSMLLTFCRGLGIVANDYQHAGTDFGSHVVLTGYLLQ